MTVSMNWKRAYRMNKLDDVTPVDSGKCAGCTCLHCEGKIKYIVWALIPLLPLLLVKELYINLPFPIINSHF